MCSTNYTSVLKGIDSNKDILERVSREIWLHPELKFEEVHAHKVLTNELEKLGFSVQRHYFLETAFRAEFCAKGGDKPVIAVLCEYDALPEIGHACGHNLIAESGLAAGIGIKAFMEANPSISGKVVVLGTPAEEGGGGKVALIKFGAFKDIDAAVMAHPSPVNDMYPPFLGIKRYSVKYTGKAAHAAGYPWEGVNALDAAVACYNTVSMMRQQVKPTCRIHGIIVKGGSASNIIPSETELEFYLRAPSNPEIKVLQQKIEACFNAAALATGCQVVYTTIGGYKHLISNKVLGSLYQKHAECLGTVFISKEEESFVASSDIGDVSHEVPSIQPLFFIGTKAPNHSVAFAEASGADKAQPFTLICSKAMAMAGVDLIVNADLLKAAKDRHSQDMAKDAAVSS